MTKQRSVRFPDALVERIDQAGIEEYRNFTQIVIMAIEEWLEAHYPETQEPPRPPEVRKPEYVIPPRKKPGPRKPQPSVGLEGEAPPPKPVNPETAPVDPYAPYDLPKIAPRRGF